MKAFAVIPCCHEENTIEKILEAEPNASLVWPCTAGSRPGTREPGP
jgi:hypothetical protein